MADQQGEVPEKSILGEIYDTVANVAEGAVDIAGDTLSAIGTGVSKFTEGAVDNIVNTASNYYEGVKDTIDTFSKGKDIFTLSEDTNKYVSKNNLITEEANLGTMERIFKNTVNFMTNTKDTVVQGVDNLFNISDGEYFNTKKDKEKALEYIDLMLKGETDQDRQKNMDTYLPRIKALMTGGVQMDESELIDKINKYQDQQKLKATAVEDMDKLDEQRKAKIEKDIIIPGEGSINSDNIKLIDNLKAGGKEKLMSIRSARDEFEIDAIRKGLPNDVVQQHLKEMDQAYSAYKDLINKSLQEAHINKDAFKRTDGTLNIYTSAMSELTDEELTAMNENERFLTKRGNILLNMGAMNSMKDGKPFSAAMGLVGNLFEGVDTILGLKSTFSSLSGTDYNRENRKSMEESLASDNNFLSLADKTGASRFFLASVNNIDDIAQGIGSAIGFNKGSGITKVVKFLDGNSGKLRHVATGLKGAVEGWAFNRGMSLSANEVASDDYMLGNALMDMPMENVINFMGKAATKLTGYTSLEQTRNFKKNMLDDMELNKELLGDLYKKNVDKLKSTDIGDLKATLDTMKSLAKSNIDYGVRNQILKNDQSLFDFGKQIGDEYAKTGSIQYNHTGLIVTNVKEGTMAKSIGTDIFTNSVLTFQKIVNGIYDTSTISYLDKFNATKLNDIVTNIKKFSKTVSSDDLGELQTLASTIKSNLKTLNLSNLSLDKDEINKKIASSLLTDMSGIDTILKRNGVGAGTYKILNVFDAITGKKYVIDPSKLRQDNKNEGRLSFYSLEDKKDIDVSLLDFKYKGSNRIKINALYDGTLQIPKEANREEFANALADELGFQYGDFGFNKKDGVLPTFFLSENKGEVKLIQTNKDGEIVDRRTLLSALEGMSRDEIVFRQHTSDLDYKGELDISNLFKYTITALQTDIRAAFGGDELLFNNYNKIMDTMISSNMYSKFFNQEIEQVLDDGTKEFKKVRMSDNQKKEIMIGQILHTVTKTKLLKEDDLLGKILELSDDSITKAQMYSSIFTGDNNYLIGKMIDSSKNNNFMKEFLKDDLYLFKKLSKEVSITDIEKAFSKTDNTQLKSLSKQIIQDILNENKNMSKFFINDVFTAEARYSLSKKESILDLIRGGSKNRNRVVNETIEALSVRSETQFSSLQSIKNALNTRLKELETSPESNAAMIKNIKQDLVKAEMYLNKEVQGQNEIKRIKLEVLNVKNIQDLTVLEDSIVKRIKDDNNITEVILEDLIGLYKEIVKKKSKLTGDIFELDIDALINKITNIETLKDSILKQGSIYNGFYNKDSLDITNWGDTPHYKLVNYVLKRDNKVSIDNKDLGAEYEKEIFTKYEVDISKIRALSMDDNDYLVRLYNTSYGQDLFKLSPVTTIGNIRLNSTHILGSAQHNGFIEGLSIISGEIGRAQKKLMNQGINYNDQVMKDLILYHRELLRKHTYANMNAIKEVEGETWVDLGKRLILKFTEGNNSNKVDSLKAVINDVLESISKGKTNFFNDQELRALEKKLSKHLLEENTGAHYLIKSLGIEDGNILGLLEREAGKVKKIPNGKVVGSNIDTVIKKIKDFGTDIESEKLDDLSDIFPKIDTIYGLIKGNFDDDSYITKLYNGLYNTKINKDGIKNIPNLNNIASDAVVTIKELVKDYLNNLLYNKILDSLPEEMFVKIKIGAEQDFKNLNEYLEKATGFNSILKSNKELKDSGIAKLFDRILGDEKSDKDGFNLTTFQKYIKAIYEKEKEVEKSKKLISEDITKVKEEEHIRLFDELYGLLNNTIVNRAKNDKTELGLKEDLEEVFKKNDEKIRKKFMNQIQNFNGSYHQKMETYTGTGKIVRYVNEQGSINVNKLTQLGDMISIPRIISSVADKMSGKTVELTSYLYQGTKLIQYDKMFMYDLRKKFNIPKDTSDVHILTTFTLLNNVKYVDKLQSKSIIDMYKNIHYEPGLNPGFSKEEFNAFKNQLKDFKGLGENYLIPNIGEDGKQGIAINLNENSIKNIFKSLGIKQGPLDNTYDQVIAVLHSMEKKIFGDIKEALGFPLKEEKNELMESMNKTDFMKRLKQHLTLGSGLLSYDGNLRQFNTNIAPFSSVIKGIGGDTKSILTKGSKQSVSNLFDTFSDKQEMSFNKSEVDELITKFGSDTIDLTGTEHIDGTPNWGLDQELKETIDEGIKNLLSMEKDFKERGIDYEGAVKVIDVYRNFIKDYNENWIYNKDVVEELDGLVNKLRDTILKDNYKREYIVRNIIEKKVTNALKDFNTTKFINQIKLNENLKKQSQSIPSGDTINLKELLNLKIDPITERYVTKGYHYLLKGILINSNPNFKNMLENGLGIKGELTGQDYIDLMKDEDRLKTLMGAVEKMYETVDTDTLDGMGYMSRSVARRIYIDRTGKVPTEEQLSDGKFHITDGLTKIRQMVLSEDDDKAIRKEFEKIKGINLGQDEDFIISPKGGVKVGKDNFNKIDSDKNKITLEGRDIGVDGHKSINYSDIQVAASDAIEHKDTMKVSTQLMSTTEGNTFDMMSKLMKRLIDEKITTLNALDNGGALKDSGSQYTTSGQINESIDNEKKSILALVTGYETAGSDLPLAGSGLYKETKGGKYLVTEKDKIYMSETYHKKMLDKGTFFTINGKNYVVAGRNPVPTEYNRSLVEVKINYALKGYNISAHPEDVLLKKEADHDGDKLFIIGNDKGTKGLMNKLMFIDTLRKTNLSSKIEGLNFRGKEGTNIDKHINEIFNSIKDLDGLRNEFIFTKQINEGVATAIEYTDTIKKGRSLFSFIGPKTLEAKSEIANVATAVMNLNYLENSVKNYLETGQSTMYGNIDELLANAGMTEISLEGKSIIASVVQQTLDAAKSTTDFDTDWMNSILKSFTGYKDLKPQEAGVIKNIITQIGPHIMKAKKMKVGEFQDYDLKFLNRSTSDLYDYMQSSMSKLDSYKITDGERIKFYKALFYKDLEYINIEGKPINEKEELQVFKNEIIDKGFLSSIEHRKRLDQLLKLPEFSVLDYIKNLSVSEESIISKQVGEDGWGYKGLNALLSASVGGVEQLQAYTRDGLKIYRKGKDIIVEMNKYEFNQGLGNKGVSNDLKKYFANDYMTQSGIVDKKNVILSYLARGDTDMFLLLNEKENRALELVSLLSHGAKRGINIMKGNVVEGQTVADLYDEIIGKISSQDSDIRKTIEELYGKDFEKKISLQINQKDGQADVSVIPYNQAIDEIRKASNPLNTDNIDTDMIENWMRLGKDPDVILGFTYKNGKISIGKQEKYNIDKIHNTTGVYKEVYQSDEAYRNAVDINLYSIRTGATDEMVKKLHEVEGLMTDATSIVMHSKFYKYMPTLWKRILEVKDTHRVELQLLTRDLNDIKGNYKDLFRNNEQLSHLLDNKIFVTALNTSGASDVSNKVDLSGLDIPQDSIEKIKQYVGEVSQHFATKIYSIANDINLKKDFFNSNYKGSSYLYDFLEVGGGGSKFFMYEQGIVTKGDMERYLKEVSPNMSQREVNRVANALLNLGNDGGIIRGIKKFKTEMYAHKYGWIGAVTGYSLMTTILQMIPDFLRMISKKSPSFSDIRITQFGVNNKILNSEVLREGDNIFDNIDSSVAWINKPIQVLTDVFKSFIPGTKMKDVAGMLSTLMQNPLMLNEKLLGSTRRKIALASAFDMMAKNMDMSMDDVWGLYYRMRHEGKGKEFEDMIRAISYNNLMNMSGGASTLSVGQETIFSRGWHNAYNFLQNWSNFMTNSHVEATSHLFSGVKSMFNGDKLARKVHFNKFMDYLYGNLVNTVIAAAALTKYNMYFNNTVTEDGEYDYYTYVKDMNNAITGAQSFAIFSALDDIAKHYDGHNNSYMSNVAMMGKTILSKLGTESKLLRDIVGFVGVSLKEGLPQEDILNGITDIYKNNITGFLRYNRFEENDGWYENSYSNNMFATAMGVNDKVSMEEVSELIKTQGAITTMGLKNPYGLLNSVTGAAGYLQLLKQFYSPESFHVLEVQFDKWKSIKQNDPILQKISYKGIDQDILNKIMLKEGLVDRAYTDTIFNKLTSYSSMGLGDFLIDKDGGINPLQPGKNTLVDSLIVSKLESKYGVEMTKAIIRGSRDEIARHITNQLQEKIGIEMLQTIRDEKGGDTEKRRKDLLVAADRSGITVPTMISVFMYDDFTKNRKTMTDDQSQYLAVKKYAPLMNLSVPAQMDVANLYTTKYHGDKLQGIMDTRNGVNTLKKVLENKVLIDMVIARSFNEDGDTSVNLLRSNYAGLFNSSYNEARANGFKKEDVRRIITDFVRADTMLDTLVGRVDGNKVMMYKEAMFTSMLNKPEVMKELSDTENKIFDGVRDNLIHRLFKFKTETDGFDLPRLQDIVKENYNKSIGIYGKHSGTGNAFKGQSNQFRPSQGRGASMAAAKDLLPRMIAKGQDITKPAKTIFHNLNPMATASYNGGPDQYREGLKHFIRKDTKDYFDEIGKDLFKKSPIYFNKIFSLRKINAEKIRQEKLVIKPAKAMKGSTKIMKGLAMSRN